MILAERELIMPSHFRNIITMCLTHVHTMTMHSVWTDKLKREEGEAARAVIIILNHAYADCYMHTSKGCIHS